MRADRLLAILLHLQVHQKMTTQALADTLEVSRRTILRDIEALSTAGVPIYTQSGEGGGIGLDEQYRLSLNGLHEAEVKALFLSGNLKLLADIGLESASEQLLLKFFAGLPALHRQRIEEMRQRVFIDSDWWVEQDTPAHVPTLMDAINHGQMLEITYQTHTGEHIERTIEPYGLVAKGGVWYLVARRDNAFRTYRASRLVSITALAQTFQRQPDFDLQRFWKDSAQQFFMSLLEYRYALKIHPRRKRFIDTYATGRHEVIATDPADGWLTVAFESEHIEAALMLVFGLGEDVIILEPESLRAEAVKRSHKIINRDG